MGWTKSYEKLVPQRPPGSLMSGPNLVSIFAQILVTLLIQIGAYVYLSHQSWYQPLDPPTPEKEIVLCWETTTVFCVSSFQYLILAAVFSKGRPYRQPFYSNLPFLISLIVLIGFTGKIFLFVYSRIHLPLMDGPSVKCVAKKLFCFSFEFNENLCVLKLHQVSLNSNEKPKKDI